jgi:hypothetical protein
MALNTTRGGLQPASVVNLFTNEEVRCMFNPNEYTLTKQNRWQKKPVKGKNVPLVIFQQGGAQTLKLTLHFDTLAEGTDVRDHTDPLWKMMMVDEQSENPRSGKSFPPLVAFRWGKLNFQAVITNLSQKFTLFLDNGTPVRCTVDITLEQLIDVDDYAPQAPDGAVAGAAQQVVTAVAGDRLDAIAAAAGQAAESWREIAEANNIDDPLSIRPGQTLRI